MAGTTSSNQGRSEGRIFCHLATRGLSIGSHQYSVALSTSDLEQSVCSLGKVHALDQLLSIQPKDVRKLTCGRPRRQNVQLVVETAVPDQIAS